MSSNFDEFRRRLLGSVGEMPSNQVNADVPDELLMRVGIPHRSGSLAVHAFNREYAAMVSASAFYDKSGRFIEPTATPLTDINWALDSAGFTAMLGWQAKGAQPGIEGIFPWTLEAYLTFANLMRPAWYTQPDCCVEAAVAGSREEVIRRVDLTAKMLGDALDMLYGWQEALARDVSVSTVEEMVRPCVPVIQGWTASDYQRSLEMMLKTWERKQPWLAAPALIGIGSVCRRHLDHPEHGILAILNALEPYLPKKTRVHMFGVKGTAIEVLRMFEFVASYDSMAWDISARRNAYANRTSNTMAHRGSEMDKWMARAAEHMKPKAGDQFRLAFS